MTDPDDPPAPRFHGARHAIFCGWVLGIALRHGVPVVPVLDKAGNYTDRFTITLPGGERITVIVPPPSPDWELPTDRARVTGSWAADPRWKDGARGG